jgi:hypothetical protein
MRTKLEGKGPGYVFRDTGIEVERVEQRTLTEIFAAGALPHGHETSASVGLPGAAG